MLHDALVCIVVVRIAAPLGFGGLAPGAASLAKLLLVVFVVLALVSCIAGLTRRR